MSSSARVFALEPLEGSDGSAVVTEQHVVGALVGEGRVVGRATSRALSWSGPSLSRRIGGETEPTNLPTETNTGRGVVDARGSLSPVRNGSGARAKTARNRGILQAVPEDDWKVFARQTEWRSK